MNSSVCTTVMKPKMFDCYLRKLSSFEKSFWQKAYNHVCGSTYTNSDGRARIKEFQVKSETNESIRRIFKEWDIESELRMCVDFSVWWIGYGIVSSFFGRESHAFFDRRRTEPLSNCLRGKNGNYGISLDKYYLKWNQPVHLTGTGWKKLFFFVSCASYMPWMYLSKGHTCVFQIIYK